MFIVSSTIIYIYYNNNYETETPKNKRNIKNKDILLKDMFIVSLTIIYIYYNNNYETEHKIKNKLSKNIIN